eukprot:2372124-Pyramimonas_sp.AAC.1
MNNLWKTARSASFRCFASDGPLRSPTALCGLPHCGERFGPSISMEPGAFCKEARVPDLRSYSGFSILLHPADPLRRDCFTASTPTGLGPQDSLRRPQT